MQFVRTTATGAFCLLTASGFAQPAAHAEDVIVMASGGMAAAVAALEPDVTHAGDRLRVVRGPSMGGTADAIANRLARGERCDVVAMVGTALDRLHVRGTVDAGTTLAGSRIGVVIRAGAPRPRIDTRDALRQTLLAAPSVAYSDSASGVYVAHELFRRLGIETQLRRKAREIAETPVAKIVADGDAALGFQQISEILPIRGAELLGPLPDAVQKITPFAAATCVPALHPLAARRFMRLLTSSRASSAMRRAGLDPVAKDAR